jgi:hypothetical protein
LVIAGSRLVLNLKVYAAERDSYDDLGLTIHQNTVLSPSAFRIPDLPISQDDGSSDHQTTPTGSIYDHERGW